MTPGLDRIEALAPDQASLDAARKLLKPASWPTLARHADLVWGECQGSGTTPYRVVVSELDAGTKCTCPSRKFPCKHALALMWMRAEGKPAFAEAPVPDWITDWLSRRRAPATAKAEAGERKPTASIAATAIVEDAAPDPQAEARSAAARERNRKERESSILAGLDELDLWLADQVETGLAGFATQATHSCRLIAQRLVDAKASGLATRLESLPARLFALPEAARPAAVVAELGLLHLLAEAYRRQETLPAPLQADLRQMVGWSQSREALLGDAEAVRCASIWRVVAARSEVQPDKLRRLETWLCREGAGEGPGFAVLIDFVPVSAGATAGGFATGDRLEAELVFYPSPVPLRAVIARQASGAAACAEPLALPDRQLGDAYRLYEEALAARPWLGDWPLGFRAARLRRHGEAIYLCDAGTDGHLAALPLRPAQHEEVAPLLAIETLDGIGLWDGRHFSLCWAETGLGRWVEA